MGWSVKPISVREAKSWIVDRHYAHRMPPTMILAGLFDEDGWIRGVCSFGPPPRMWNDGYGLFDGKYQCDVYELNRLVIDDDIEQPLTWFVAR